MTEATEHTQDVYVNLKPKKIRLSSMSVGLFLFCMSGSLFFFLDSTYKHHIIFAFFCLTSPSMTISRFIQVASNGMISLSYG